MSRNLQSPSKLTEFAPLSPEPNQPGVGLFLSRIFKFNKGNALTENSGGISGVSQDLRSTSPPQTGGVVSGSNWQSTESLATLPADSPPFPLDVADGRSLPNVLKRISNLLALKSTGLQAYKDTDFKQYWMPDSVSKQCYDCGEKFTTFRRRHHCRVCGQIFCSRCCNQEIPGKIMGCTGDLRVCTYCCKVVLSYLQSADMGADLSADLRTLQEDLQIKFGISAVSPSSSTGQPSLGSVAPDGGDGSVSRRRASITFQEDLFAGRGLGSVSGNMQTFLSVEERCRALQRSMSLRSLHDQLSQPGFGLVLQTHRYRLRQYSNCFLGSEMVDWLLGRSHAATRIQGSAIGQALIDGGFLESIAEASFIDGYALYRLQPLPPLPSPQILPSETHSCGQDLQESMWNLPQQDSLGTDSESECHISEENCDIFSLPSSNSTFYLDLNVESNTVTLSRPRAEPDENRESVENALSLSTSQSPSEKVHDCCHTGISSEFLSGTLWLQHPSAVPHEPPPTNNEEELARSRLQAAYEQHESGLLRQLLSAEALTQTWSEVLLPLVGQAASSVQPDLRGNAGKMDIRWYIQFKKVPGGTRADSKLIDGLVCNKNVAHRAMARRIVNPRILCLTCAIVYQRIEGRLLSLEPVLMQEREYLRNVVARIEALKPSLVLVHRNVSRLAQELLLELGIVLVLNVKASVLERVARCTGADIVNTVDAHIGRPQLGTCRLFYLQTFRCDSGHKKTLMFFEGCSKPKLGATVLLRGAPEQELHRVKRVAQLLLFARYSWRLELSFLMDEGARPPSPPRDPTFFDDQNSPPLSTADAPDLPEDQVFDDGHSHCGHKEDTPLLPVPKDKSPTEDKKITSVCKDKSPSEDKRTAAESVSDFSDPLRCYLTLEDEVFIVEPQPEAEPLPVAELPLCNRFRKALDGTILSTSPYLQFSVPYMETEAGRSSALWKYFPHEIFWSAQFNEITQNGAVPGISSASVSANEPELKVNGVKAHYSLLPQHPFVLAKLRSSADSKEIQSLLSNFRACGGRLRPPSPTSATNAVILRESPNTHFPNSAFWPDALDPRSHQHLCVLFCSYAHESNNAPAFCVKPWVVRMEFYDSDNDIDIPLGGFLERYCFQSSYLCPSATCDTPMLEHVRRFVHDGGCVHVFLRNLEQPIPGDAGTIYMWSWCSCCRDGSSMVPMSADTWAFSFAKFLELRFHGHVYRRLGGCTHSLHHDHLLYFGCRSVVASFRYTSIVQREISLPSPLIILNAVPQQQVVVIEEIKKLALKGYEVFSCILERLCSFSVEMDVSSLKQQLQKEQAYYKSRIEEIQLKLTSPTLEAKKLEGKNAERDVQQLMWHIEDAVVLLKRLIADTVEVWNTRLQEIAVTRKREERHRRTESSTGIGSRHSTQNLSLDYDEDASTAEVASPGDSSDGPDEELGSPGEPETVPVLENDLPVPQISQLESGENTSTSDTQPAGLSSDLILIQQNEVPEDVPISVNTSPRPATRFPPLPHADTLDGDNLDGKPAQKIVKTLLSQLLPSAGLLPPIQSPLSPQEHPLGTTTCVPPIIIYESEPSSVIACALGSAEYRQSLEELRRGTASDQPSPSPVHKRTAQGNNDRDVTTSPMVGSSSTNLDTAGITSESGTGRRAGVLSFLRGSSSGNSGRPGVLDGVQYSATVTPTVPHSGIESGPPEAEELMPGSNKNSKTSASTQHIEVPFSDSSCSFSCRIYFAEQFATLRQAVLPIGEEAFMRSLSRCVQWAARGGKSGSNFCKTRDDRFVLKEMSRLEMQLFLDFAPHYFSYVHTCLNSCQPTLLGKIVGVFRIKFRNTATNTALNSNLLIMENLFYQRCVTHKFDLKGSVRNRLVNPSAEHAGEIVLLDENLLKMTCDSPLYISPHSKSVLMQAINIDTQFLASQEVMDYSLLVGVDEERKELVVGIIDYIRTFTWDKKLEAMVKYYGNLGSGQAKLPTVVSPELYRTRFIAAMDRYFLPVPDRWTQLGRGLMDNMS